MSRPSRLSYMIVRNSSLVENPRWERTSQLWIVGIIGIFLAIPYASQRAFAVLDRLPYWENRI
jgi:SNF family Na+-dependent transporter